MKRNLGITGKRAGALLFALALATAAPFAALAQEAALPDAATVEAVQQTADDALTGPRGIGFGNGRGGMKSGQTGDRLEADDLTDEQKAVYDSALARLREIEDAVLADLVAAAAVTQADVDAYTAMRTARASLDGLDMSAWTAAQEKAYYEAMQQTGDARKAALQALADAGTLTQAQADALAGLGTADLWQTLRQNAGTNTAVQAALKTMQQARQTMNRKLREAGIEGMRMGGGMPGFGQGQPNGMENNGQNGGNRPNRRDRNAGGNGNAMGPQAQETQP
jgi:hypothetical protein